MTIKHIVLSGGGPVGLVEYGAFKELNIKNYWKLENIKSIYATSIGTIMSLFIILDIKWEWLDDYLIKRPWENLLNFSTDDYLNLFFSKGLLDEKFTIECIKSLLLTKDLSIDITLKELYEKTNISLHIFTTNLNKVSKLDINHKTFPDMKLVRAIYMSCCVPVMFKPIYLNNTYYIDGGFITNVPVNDCLNNEKCKKTEILVFDNDKRNPIDISNNYFQNIKNENNNLQDNSNIFTFILHMLKTFVKYINVIENENLVTLKNSINVCITENVVDLNYWNYVLTNSEERSRLIELGKTQANNFLNLT